MTGAEAGNSGKKGTRKGKELDRSRETVAADRQDQRQTERKR